MLLIFFDWRKAYDGKLNQIEIFVIIYLLDMFLLPSQVSQGSINPQGRKDWMIDDTNEIVNVLQLLLNGLKESTFILDVKGNVLLLIMLC
jgi:hypothetical protein